MKSFVARLREALGLFGIVRREPLRFAVYSSVNILIGALGIIAPIAAGLYLAPGPVRDLTRVLQDGNGYTFALALLATSSAFLANDVIDRRKTSYVGLRVFAAGGALALLLTLASFSGVHFAAKVLQALAPATAQLTFKDDAMRQWTGRETWQAGLVLMTVAYGIWLFCLQRIDAYDDFAQGFRDKRSELIIRANEASSGSGIEA